MDLDQDIANLLADASFGDAEMRPDRYPAALRAGLTQHGLRPLDVVAVVRDRGMWVLCRTGVFHAQLLSAVATETRISHLLAWPDVAQVIDEPGDGASRQLVMLGRTGERLVTIRLDPGSPEAARGAELLGLLQRVVRRRVRA